TGHKLINISKDSSNKVYEEIRKPQISDEIKKEPSTTSFTDRAMHSRARVQKTMKQASQPKTTSFAQKPAKAYISSESKKPTADDMDERIDPSSGLRIKDRVVSKDKMKGYMQGRQFAPLKNIAKYKGDYNVAGDWVTIGVLMEKIIVRKEEKNCTFNLSDLQGNTINVFLFDEAFTRHSKEVVGGVFAILNPDILPSAEVNSTVALGVDNPDQMLRMGQSIDFNICKGVTDGKRCNAILDNFPLVSLKDGNKSKKVEPRQAPTTGGSYILKPGHTISANGSRTKLMNIGEATKPTPLTPDELAKLLNDNDRGAKCVRMLRGISIAPKGTSKAGVFGHDALRKLGFDPISGKEVIVPKNDNGSPRKVGTSVNGSLPGSPMGVNKLLGLGAGVPANSSSWDEDDDIEIEDEDEGKDNNESGVENAR
ncbi:minichromosome maintenance- protein, partial [Blyttiomyces sp. JEL0837]